MRQRTWRLTMDQDRPQSRRPDRRHVKRLPASVAIALLAAFACNQAPEPPPPAPGQPVANPDIAPAAGGGQRPNVAPEGSQSNIILISVDTLRADRLALAPRIDAWAKRHATVFRSAVAQAPWTLPSHASMLTGLDALRHGANHSFQAAPEELSTVAERLRDAGYFTAGITGGAWLDPRYGLAQGFERYRAWSEKQLGDREIEAHAALAADWLGELPEPFFLFLHTFDVHDFNAPRRRAQFAARPDDPRSHRAQLYDLAVSHMDDHVGGFLEHLESLDMHSRTVVVLTSDHGEDLGEDGVIGHGSLREQVLRVPLVLKSAGGRGAGRLIERQVRSVDLVPTLLDFAGVEAPTGLDGVSLRGLIEGEAARVPPVATSYFSLAHGISLRLENRWKYVYDASAWAPGTEAEPPREALYRLPGGELPERDGLAPDHPLAARLRAHARRLLDERLAGLRLRIDNLALAPLRSDALPSPFAGTIRGALIGAGVPKSTGAPGLWLRRIADDAASFSVPPGQRFELLFEHVDEPRFELEATPPGGGPAHRQEVDLDAMTLPVTFQWTGSGWQIAAGASPPATGVTLEWHRGAELGGAPPFEQDPELRRQLEALGYLD